MEAGVVGLVLALVGLLLTVRECWRLRNALRAPPLSGLVGTLVASFFLSNFEYNFFWMNLMYCLMCRSVAIGAGRTAATADVLRQPRTPETPSSWPTMRAPTPPISGAEQ